VPVFSVARHGGDAPAENDRLLELLAEPVEIAALPTLLRR
jgi:hypothetical protein